MLANPNRRRESTGVLVTTITTAASIRTSMKGLRSISSLLAITVALFDIQSVQPKDIRARKIEFVNRSGKKLVVEWVNPKTGEVVTIQDDLGNGEASMLDTFVNHTFAIHEPGNESCTLESCGVKYVTVTKNKEQSKTTYT